jgi:hypothetical protein
MKNEITTIEELRHAYDNMSGWSGGWTVMLTCFQGTFQRCYPYMGHGPELAYTVPYSPGEYGQTHIKRMALELDAEVTPLPGDMVIATVPFSTLKRAVLNNAVREGIRNGHRKLTGPQKPLP